MGHAYPTNICQRLHKQLYAKGKVSIAQVAQSCVKNKEYLHCAEGDYGDDETGDSMIREVLGTIIHFYLQNQHELAPAKFTPILEVVLPLSPEQESVYTQWMKGENDHWDCGDDGNGGEYGIFDSILWQFAPGWRNKYPEIPILSYICS